MSYPKVPPKPNVSTATRLSEQRKQRLLKLQEREELKGLLVNKFKAKYGKNLPFIDREVEKFIRDNTLTEANLRKLDEQIKGHVERGGYEVPASGPSQPSKPGSVKSVVSQRSAASAVSRQSGASQRSAASKQSSGPRQPQRGGPRSQSDIDSMSVTSSKKSSSYVPDDDEDEWAAILEYDTMLYREEERARQRREEENKIKMKRELDRQMHERHGKKRRRVRRRADV